MELTLQILTIVLAVMLILSILSQQRGTGLGGTFGGENTVYRTRRGAEKFIFRLTIVLAILFAGSALANVILFK